ncbi:MAG: DUF1501 domain-containing protein [Planctomycetota bacterium]
MRRERPPHWLDRPLARREAFGQIARATLGVGLVPGLSQQLEAATTQSGGHAKNIIFLMMQGAMSQIDTFDPKPGREEQGETTPIQTKTPGVLFGGTLEKLAGLSDRLAVIRSVTTETGAHEQGQYLMRTSYPMINSIRHPALGSWALQSMGKISKDLPGYVLIGNGNDHPGAGFLDPGLTPVPIADPTKGLENTRRPGYLTQENFDRRLTLADRIDRDFKRRYAGPQLEAYNQLYKDAVRLMGSVDLQAFDIAQEKPAVRSRYGDSKLGLGCLLARRLVESGVRCVEVDFGGWDMHREVFDEMGEKGPELDQALSTLLEDLDDRGLLASTLVVLATEFGRTPRINENAGRDHHPGVFSCVLAGAGVRGGVVHGMSDEKAFRPERDPVSVADFTTTIAAACGLPYDKEFHAPNGRPFKIGGGGKPISAVLA